MKDDLKLLGDIEKRAKKLPQGLLSVAIDAAGGEDITTEQCRVLTQVVERIGRLSPTARDMAGSHLESLRGASPKPYESEPEI